MTRAQLGRPVGASGEETRQRIIVATMRCVAKVGYSRATIREIARTANVSHSTVSRALRNSPLVNAETSALIRKIAAEQGYTVSAAARRRLNGISSLIERINVRTRTGDAVGDCALRVDRSKRKMDVWVGHEPRKNPGNARLVRIRG